MEIRLTVQLLFSESVLGHLGNFFSSLNRAQVILHTQSLLIDNRHANSLLQDKYNGVSMQLFILYRDVIESKL